MMTASSIESARAGEYACRVTDDTLTRHCVDGFWTPERAFLHREILNAAVVGRPFRRYPRAVFLAGGPAAGKSSVRPLVIDDSFVVVDVDGIREQLPEYEELVAAQNDGAAPLTHEEASFIGRELAALANRLGTNVCIDGVGSNEGGKFVEKITAYRKNAYAVTVVYVTVPLEIARAREAVRRQKTGRVVPTDVLERGHEAASASARDVVADTSVDVEVWDARESDPLLIARRVGGADLEILAADLYDEFVEKG